MLDASITRPRRVGHKGAAHIEPGNTLASFDAALRHGVDMIELDVLSERPDGSGRLLVAHDYRDMREREPLPFERALEHLRGESFGGIELDVDVKWRGYEHRVLGALRDFDLIGRTLLSGMYTESLDLIRAAEPGLRLGWSVPRGGGAREFEQDGPTAAPLKGNDAADGRDLFARARLQLKAAPALTRSVGGPQPDVFRGGLAQVRPALGAGVQVLQAKAHEHLV